MHTYNLFMPICDIPCVCRHKPSYAYTSLYMSCIRICLTGVCIVEGCQPDIDGHYHASYGFGIMSVCTAILTSGFAGVYYEKILKSSKSSV